MASTLTSSAEAPGVGGKRPVQFGGARVGVFRQYNLAFGNPYVVGGESISAIFDDFVEVLAIYVSQNDATVADRREFMVDMTNKKLIMFTAFNTESGAVDQTAVGSVKLLVIGY